MKLQQLHYFCEIVDRDLNVSRAAAALHISQPGVSRQLRLLEAELGAPVFERRGARVVALTAAGRAILPAARRMLLEARNMLLDAREGEGAVVRMSIATTHTHARYAVLPALQRFRRSYPAISVTLSQTSPQRIAQLVVSGAADIGVATEPLEPVAGLARERCYQLEHSVIVPRGHALLRERQLDLAVLARHPLITYEASFRLGRLVRERFAAAGLAPDIVISAIDSDIIKAYVEAGFGVAILPAICCDATRDRALRAIPAGHLFELSTCQVMTLRGRHLPPHLSEFIAQLKAPRGR